MVLMLFGVRGPETCAARVGTLVRQTLGRHRSLKSQPRGKVSASLISTTFKCADFSSLHMLRLVRRSHSDLAFELYILDHREIYWSNECISSTWNFAWTRKYPNIPCTACCYC